MPKWGAKKDYLNDAIADMVSDYRRKPPAISKEDMAGMRKWRQDIDIEYTAQAVRPMLESDGCVFLDPKVKPEIVLSFHPNVSTYEYTAPEDMVVSMVRAAIGGQHYPLTLDQEIGLYTGDTISIPLSAPVMQVLTELYNNAKAQVGYP